MVCLTSFLVGVEGIRFSEDILIENNAIIATKSSAQMISIQKSMDGIDLMEDLKEIIDEGPSNSFIYNVKIIN
jgi:hypothetical protein